MTKFLELVAVIIISGLVAGLSFLVGSLLFSFIYWEWMWLDSTTFRIIVIGYALLFGHEYLKDDE
jgi:hypothetical protein